MPLVPVLSRMERTGALLDEERLWEQSRELGQRLQALEEEAHNLAGQVFNLGSPKQLGEILFDAWAAGAAQNAEGRAVHGRGGAAGARPRLPAAAPASSSTARLSKLKGTYTDKLPGLINPTRGASTPPTTRP
jgi:DNA polymerase-1